MIVVGVGTSVWSVAFELAGVLPILVLDRVGATGVVGGRFLRMKRGGKHRLIWSLVFNRKRWRKGQNCYHM